MAETRRCAQCGTELSVDDPEGLCPQCLLAAGLESSVTDADPAGEIPTIPPDWGRQTDRADTPTLPPTKDAENAGRSLTIGEKVRYFGDYELLEEIARGGMGAGQSHVEAGIGPMIA